MRLFRETGWRVALPAVAVLAALAACGAPSQPPLEQSPAERTKLLTIPDEYKNRRNGLPATEANVREGRARYEAYCALCHGPDGKAGTALGRNLFPQASDLTSRKVQSYSDGQLYWIVSEGVRYSGMPAGRLLHTEEQIWKIVLYLRRLQESHRAAEAQSQRLQP